MTIVFYDGGTLTCNKIEFCGLNTLIVDGFRIVRMDKVLCILSNEDSLEEGQRDEDQDFPD